jgi:hypothetical protein
MFVSDKLIYLELHKTGGTHIGKLLSGVLQGSQIGKHNRLPVHLRDRFIIGSIRNPWDWYVSLWAYGCSGRGSVFRQTTRGIDLSYLSRQLGREMGITGWPISILVRQAMNDIRRPKHTWQSCYVDPSATDATLFRSWLKLIFSPTRRFDLGEGFGFSPASACAGLLTYRYLKLFTSLDHSLYSDERLSTLHGIRDAWAKHRLVHFIIRQDRLEDDFVRAIEAAGIDLTDNQRAELSAARGDKTNTSKRLAPEHYYDDETTALVAERDQLIIEEHGFIAPNSH